MFRVEREVVKTLFPSVFLLTSGPAFWLLFSGSEEVKGRLNTHAESYTVTSNPCTAPQAKQGERKASKRKDNSEETLFTLNYIPRLIPTLMIHHGGKPDEYFVCF